MEGVEIYTDGACSGNPGPGGWGAILMYKGIEKELYGYEPETTNNRMELMAVIEALKAINKPIPITLYTDSQYVIHGITKWMVQWKKNSWKTASKSPVKNSDLWQHLDQIVKGLTINWVWVKGHQGNVGNERADALARKAIEENR